jgi:hypothetical protein
MYIYKYIYIHIYIRTSRVRAKACLLDPLAHLDLPGQHRGDVTVTLRQGPVMVGPGMGVAEGGGRGEVEI